ncbi:MAG: hypothetical protein N3H84_08340, partial [Candidatus Caldarchaeum sp.]|nr:hypothetical protein [Candidatus Caldarchaeum sp.]
ATIPPELSQRFLIREGQEYTIVGMSRANPDFEGALQIYLGFFVVLEKAPRLDLVVENVDFGVLEQVLKKAGASSVVLKKVEDKSVHVSALFTAVEKNRVKLPKTVEAVGQLVGDVKRDVEALGGFVKSFEVVETVVESRQTDPAVLAKGPSRLEKAVAWKWEI